MKDIKWGIIGCGNVTEVKSGPAFNKVANSSLVAVMRRDAEKAKDYATRHNVPKWYNDATALINDEDVNAIYIATPPSSHEAYALEALAAGKPVYVEKPMSLSKASCGRMLAASNDNNVKLSIAHYRRQLPLFLTIKNLLAEKAIGDIRYVNMELCQPRNTKIVAKTSNSWKLDPAISGGGYFHDLAPHQLDLMLYFFGEIKSANGNSSNQARFSEADDLVSGEILFENDILFKGLWCFNVYEGANRDICEIVGSAGKIEFSVFGEWYKLYKNKEVVHYDIPYPKHVQQPMIEQVVQYFLGEAQNPCSPQDGIKVMGLMDRFTSKK